MNTLLVCLLLSANPSKPAQAPPCRVPTAQAPCPCPGGGMCVCSDGVCKCGGVCSCSSCPGKQKVAKWLVISVRERLLGGVWWIVTQDGVKGDRYRDFRDARDEAERRNEAAKRPAKAAPAVPRTLMLPSRRSGGNC